MGRDLQDLRAEAANRQRGILPRRIRQAARQTGVGPMSLVLREARISSADNCGLRKVDVPVFLVSRQTGVGRLLCRPAASRKRDLLLANHGPVQRTVAMACKVHDDTIDGSLGRRAGESVVFRQAASPATASTPIFAE